MASTMHVEVVSAEQHVFSADITELYARGVEGEIGILAGHQPAVIALDVGAVTLVLPDGKRELVAVHHGVLFVGQDGKAIVLADIAELAGEIDVERAKMRYAELENVQRDHDDPAVADSLRKQQLRIDVAAGRAAAPA